MVCWSVIRPRNRTDSSLSGSSHKSSLGPIYPWMFLREPTAWMIWLICAMRKWMNLPFLQHRQPCICLTSPSCEHASALDLSLDGFWEHLKLYYWSPCRPAQESSGMPILLCLSGCTLWCTSVGNYVSVAAPQWYTPICKLEGYYGMWKKWSTDVSRSRYLLFILPLHCNCV